jgi:hypothetical protein
VQLITGFGIWFGWMPNVASMHLGLGSFLALIVWMVALIALFALPKRGTALFTLLWGGLMLWLGMAQTGLLVGSLHWTVRVAHLLVGLAALGMVESLAKAVKLHWATRATS